MKDAPAFLRGDGPLLFEIGLGQERQVEMRFTRTKRYGAVRGVTNQDGEVRVLEARRLPG